MSTIQLPTLEMPIHCVVTFLAAADEIGGMLQLENLDVSENQLIALPDSICKLTKLRMLTAFKNQLKGLPNDIGKMQSLVEINIFNNKVNSWEEAEKMHL